MFEDVHLPWWLPFLLVLPTYIGGYQAYQSYNQLATLSGVMKAKAELDHFGFGSPDPFKGFNSSTADSFGLRSIPGLPKDRLTYSSELRPGLVRATYVMEMRDLSYPECIAVSTPIVFKHAEVNGQPIGPAGCERRWMPWQEGNSVVLRQGA